MDELIVDLLDYSRLSYSQHELHPIDVSGVVTDTVKVLQADIEKRQAQVEIGECVGRVVGNEPLLQQIFANLIGNALKFVAPGVAPRIRVWAEPSDSRLKIWVEDNGIGIPQEHHERIFGVFQRLNRAEDFPGTGIGLAIVRKAAEQMGGKVGLVSKPDGGSRFWVELQVG
jgi:signal transduction histidine kinase